MSRPDRELALLQFLLELDERLSGVRRSDKAHKIALRLTREFFEADHACIAVVLPGRAEREPRFRMPQEVEWTDVLGPIDAALSADTDRASPPARGSDGRTGSAAFLESDAGHAIVTPGRDLLQAPLRRRGRVWAHIVLRRLERPFDPACAKQLGRVARRISRIVQHIDTLRLVDVRSRIDRKVMEQIRPNDLFYQILHGLRSLTRYDHSAALLIYEDSPGTLEVVAEQVAWRKGKSTRIGRLIGLDPVVQGLLESGEVFGFDHRDGAWHEWAGRDVTALADACDLDRRSPDEGDDGAGAGAMLCAPLATREGAIGVLVIAARHPGSLGPYEATLVDRFLPQAAVAFRSLHRTRSLEIGIVEAERKHVIANLARGVSHDVNNALGAVLPLVQQMRADLLHDRLDEQTLERDLAQIEEALQVCRRIFGGMLSFARGEGRTIGDGDLQRAIDATLAVLDESMRRHGIEVDCQMPTRLPRVRCSQSDLEQLLLNLATNARDAMPEGGRLTIHAAAADAAVRVEIVDTGRGIAPELQARVHEPFFTTKRHGNGLGLAICRSIVYALNGKLSIESAPGEGTRVRLELPAVVVEPAR